MENNKLIQGLLHTGENFSVSIGINDLRQWHNEVISSTKKELEEIVLNDKMETYPTPKQVAEILQCDLTTLWRWAQKGYLKPIEVGGKRRYKMSEVKAILNGDRK
jgi:excisionase family DNA binding protein